MQIINNSILSLCLIIATLLLFSCSHDHDHAEGDGHNHGATAVHSEEDGHDHEDEEHEPHEEGEIHLSKEQIKTMDIQFGDFSEVKINDFVSATGTLGLPPNAYSSVSAKSSGFIKNSNQYIEGSYVKKGVVMAYLENSEFITLQQEYLEVASEMVFLRQELQRKQELVNANAGVPKDLQKVQSQVNRNNATLKGIAKQLEYLGISVANLSTDNIAERIAIVSPMAGYITSIKMHNGMYVEPNIELMEIVNESHLHLELDVFEKDIAKIKEGQKISYTVPAMENESYEGEVHVIGKEFNTENKTVRIHGHLEKKRPRFIKDLFIEAKIWLNDQTVQALPESAIVKDGASSFIYVGNPETEADEVEFEQVMVMPSLTDKGFTAVKVIGEIPDGKQIVTVGAYYVYAQSKVGSLEHSH
ncbi:MAG: efflux RND transporter periplasmic adaptor subunit [Chitinophagales bacterium]